MAIQYLSDGIHVDTGLPLSIFDGPILPNLDNFYTLGAFGKKWSEGWFGLVRVGFPGTSHSNVLLFVGSSQPQYVDMSSECKSTMYGTISHPTFKLTGDVAFMTSGKADINIVSDGVVHTISHLTTWSFFGAVSYDPNVSVPNAYTVRIYPPTVGVSNTALRIEGGYSVFRGPVIVGPDPPVPGVVGLSIECDVQMTQFSGIGTRALGVDATGKIVVL